MHVYRDMVKYNMVDAIVATGASIVDMDFFEALGFKHYQAAGNPGRQRRCARSTSTASTTPTSTRKSCRTCDHTICEIANALEPRAYSSREFIHEMGKWLAAGNAKKKDSLIQTAYEQGVPIFCPAFSDCSAGFGLVKHQVERAKARKPYMTIDASPTSAS